MFFLLIEILQITFIISIVLKNHNFIEDLMKDQQLFQHIKAIVKQKKSIPKDAEPLNFAQKYCKQQLLKKKLNPYNPYSKMTSLLKDFQELDTYVDLPELIASIKQTRIRTKQSLSQVQNPKRSFLNNIFSSSIKNKKHQKSLHQKIKKQLGQKIKQKYLSDNTFADELLNLLENQTSIRSQGLKNHSFHNLNNLLEQVERDAEDQTTQHFEAIQILNRNFNEDNKENQVQIHRNIENMYMNSQLNSKSKKQQTNLLHKISTYLQIILQTQHKRKWGTKKFKTHKRIPTEKIINHKQKKEKVNNTLSRTFRKQFSNDKCLQLFNRNSQYNQIEHSSNKLKDELKKSFYKENQLKNETSFNFKRTTTSFQLKTVASNGHLKTPKLSRYQSSFKPSFHQSRLPSVLQQRTKDVFNLRLNKQKVKQNFTFRNRNVKQKIVNKLDNFIREIDQQQHNNRKQNAYYTTAINKLQSTISNSFGQFKPQNLAQDNDIQNLTRYATFFKHGQMPQANILSNSNWIKMLSQNANPTLLNFQLQQSENYQLQSNISVL